MSRRIARVFSHCSLMHNHETMSFNDQCSTINRFVELCKKFQILDFDSEPACYLLRTFQILDNEKSSNWLEGVHKINVDILHDRSSDIASVDVDNDAEKNDTDNEKAYNELDQLYEDFNQIDENYSEQ